MSLKEQIKVRSAARLGNPFVQMAQSDRQLFKKARRDLMRENQKYPPHLVRCDDDPSRAKPLGTMELWRSKTLFVMVVDQNGYTRVTVNRSAVQNDGNWKDGISWDDLMRVKREIGRGDRYAVEVLPSEEDLVNVANMRHFFLVDKPPFAWTNKRDARS